MANRKSSNSSKTDGFNERFQAALERIWVNYNDGSAWLQIADVCNDFEEAATTYGRIIISERFLSDDKKTIKPVYDAGAIGGQKFRHGGIFFKFAVPDGRYVFTEEGAAKIAGHELKVSN